MGQKLSESDAVWRDFELLMADRPVTKAGLELFELLHSVDAENIGKTIWSIGGQRPGLLHKITG
ncbi:MAG: hypothetical protein ACRCY3_03820 [Sphingorhabdus sp.]